MDREEIIQALINKADGETQKYLQYFHAGWQIGDKSTAMIIDHVRALKLNEAEAIAWMNMMMARMNMSGSRFPELNRPVNQMVK